jgi:DNA polymerase III alpha subunit (gram-positive type)
MIFNVIDFEMNQPSRAPIQLGAVQVDLTRNKMMSRMFERNVNPGEPIADRITQLTGITDDSVQAAGSLEEVLKAFWAQCGSKRIMGWGGDAEWLLEHSDRLQVPYPKGVQTYDLKKIVEVFRPAFIPKPKGGGLRAAVHMVDREFEGRQHNAFMDALNTGYVLLGLVARMRQANLARSIFLEED